MLNCYRNQIDPIIIAAPEKGIIYCVELEGAWFRAKIEEICEDHTCQVHLIDAGTFKWINCSELHMLNENFVNLPAFSAKCKLMAPSHEYSQAQIEHFNAFRNSSEDPFAYISSTSTENGCEVLLYSSFGSEYKCISECILAAENCAIDEKENETNCTRSASSSSRRYTLEMVEIVRMKSLNSIFIELERDKAGIQRLLTDVQRYACGLDENVVSNRDWKVNDYCLLQTKLPNKFPHYWYRGKIVNVFNNDQSFTVYLRDEGFTVTVNDRIFIRPIDDRLCDVRNRAIECQLDGVQPIQGPDQSNVINQFMKIINEFDRLAISICRDREPQARRILPVILWTGKIKFDEHLLPHSEWTNVNRLLVEQKLARKGENFDLIDVTMDSTTIQERIAVETKNELENIEFVGEEIGVNIDFGIEPALGHDKYYLSDEIKTIDKWLPSGQIGKTKYVAKVTHVNKKLVIHVLDAYRRTVADAMQKKITEHVLAQKAASAKEHSTEWIKGEGQACFARFKDRNYYRAIIWRMYEGKAYCIVRFIDYGNLEYTNKKTLYPANLFGDVPSLTQKYIFANIKPTDENAECDDFGRYRWPKAVFDYCSINLVDHNCVITVIEDFSNGINTCELHRPHNEIEFGAKLVMHGDASRIN